jgi:hypothetical protein
VGGEGDDLDTFGNEAGQSKLEFGTRPIGEVFAAKGD